MNWKQSKNKPLQERLKDIEPSKGYFAIPPMNELVAELKKATYAGTPIGIVGDYDVDGICGSTILTKLLHTVGANLIITRLPKRFSEGYGLSEKIVDELYNLDVQILLTVDNGITAVEAIARAKDYGMTVWVLDHHLRRDDGLLPAADILIDPNAVEGQADWNGYCGAGLAYKLSTLILNRKHPLLDELTALAALATVADCVPLLEDNRNIVKKGLLALENELSIGLNCLLSEAGIEGSISTKNVAFKLAPMLNAPGRMLDDGAQTVSLALLLSDDFREAYTLAGRIKELNELRKEATEKEVAEILKHETATHGRAMCVVAHNVHEGLVGIYAAKLTEACGAPAIVFTDTDDPNVLHGSARSVEGVNVKEILDTLSGLLLKYGGHAAAAGLSLTKDNFDEFQRKFIEACGDVNVEHDVLYYDETITVNDVETALADIATLAPFGEGNPEPVFLLKDYDTADKHFMMQNGRSIKLYSNSTPVVALGFGQADKIIGLGMPNPVNILGTLAWNIFRGTATPQIEILDICRVED